MGIFRICMCIYIKCVCVSVYLYYYERVRDSNLPVTPLLSVCGEVDERFIGRGPHSMMETSAFC